MSQLHSQDQGESPPGGGPAGSTPLAADIQAKTWSDNTFGALRIPAYRLLWLGGLLSFVSFQMQMIARSWLAYELTESNSVLGLVMFGMGLPMLFLTPFGGVAADKLSKRQVIVSAQWLLLASGLAIAFAVVFDVIAVWMLVASAVITGIFAPVALRMYGKER